ncbi:MAG: DUF2807 domain-containing protein [Anaerolineales bacterium]|nr:DUF2807 domain-containing protein [Anaerolineales bacterium]
MKNKPLTISLTLVSLTIAFLGLFTACNGNGDPMKTVSGSGNVITEERPVSGFTAVLLQGFGQVVIDQTDKESLSITADDNLLPYIETSVQEDKLIISVKGNTLFNNVTELTYHVTVESIDSVELDGAGSIEVSHLDTDDFQVNLNGAGNIAVFGRADKQTVEIDGAGAYIAEDLISQEATVRHRGAGVAVVNVSDQLDVRIDGLGTVDYIGDPDVTQKINGPGAVQQR